MRKTLKAFCIYADLNINTKIGDVLIWMHGKSYYKTQKPNGSTYVCSVKKSHLIAILAEHIRNFGDGDVLIEYENQNNESIMESYWSGKENPEIVATAISTITFEYRDPTTLRICVHDKVIEPRKYVFLP